jgi:hypothetical protein
VTTPLDRLSEGTLDWLTASLEYFDPFSAPARTSTHRKVKAAAELALLCHCWERSDPLDDRLNKAIALVQALWQLPEFERLIAAEEPELVPMYGLIYAALAPIGIDDVLPMATLTRLSAEGYLSPQGKSPYARLETRYYADKAGVDHEIEPYEVLVGQSPPVVLSARASAAPLSVPEAYAVTHSCFYLTDFGKRDPGLADDVLARVDGLVRERLECSVRHDEWDLAAELVLSLCCLGRDPFAGPSGIAAVECLARVQRDNGAIPARSAALKATKPIPEGAFFRKAYHTTLVTAIMAMAAGSVRR